MKRRFLLTFCFLAAALVARAQQAAPPPRGEFSLSGRLVNTVTGETIRKAFVQIVPVTQRGQGQSLETGPDGAFEFHNLAAGKYNLGAQAGGFFQQSFEQHDMFSTAIAVGPNKVSTGLVFRIQPEGSITGRVLDEHNESVRDAHVLLFAKSNDVGTKLVERRGQAMTNDQGQYHFNHLRPNTFYIAVAAQPWYRRYLQPMRRNVGAGEQGQQTDPALDVAYPVTYYPGVTGSEDAGAIVVHPGDRITADFDLAPVQSVHLTIRNTTGENGQQIQPNFRERVFGDSGIFAQPTMAVSQGEIEVSGLAPGNYAVNLTQSNGNGKDNVSRVHDLSLQQSGELDAAAASSLEGIHGTIKFEGTRAANNVVLQLRDLASGSAIGAQPDERGEFSLQPDHAGRYDISIGNLPGYAIRTIAAVGARVTGRTIEFTGAQPVELTIQASEGVAIIDGTVMNGDHPASGVMVVLVPQDAANNAILFRRDQSDSDGTFTLREVVPGRYTAIAIQNGWQMEWASPEALRPYLAKGTAVQVLGKQQLNLTVAAQ
jgi:hypothetical protein